MPVIVAVFAALVCLQGAQAVKITELSVPSTVLNGSVNSIVLDCLYALESPNNTASGLVVKWYHNRSPAPVYQWIPGYPPQAFGILRGRVNLGHVISNDPQMRHRAIQLVHPRPELSGEFTCKVSTWSGVDTATKRMVIYAPVKSMSISSSRPKAHHMTLTCQAEGMYPEPEVSIVLQHSHAERERLRGLQVTKTLADGAYSVKVTKDLDEREVPVHCLIHCELITAQHRVQGGREDTAYQRRTFAIIYSDLQPTGKVHRSVTAEIIRLSVLRGPLQKQQQSVICLCRSHSTLFADSAIKRRSESRLLGGDSELLPLLSDPL
ncbi:hypothetical protein FJT64_016768 [Amphibalanus amphitrite]|uniref:Ig-like domain-containing protein n=1 Tax=Amphibalanus amphitrite TaxID=1232801 RepID=A0A6A4XDR4_AMPAM|nr:hypothetical protein FJT64_016768 [Amphibalanus amphitrite]